jgi:hypothetical protein
MKKTLVFTVMTILLGKEFLLINDNLMLIIVFGIICAIIIAQAAPYLKVLMQNIRAEYSNELTKTEQNLLSQQMLQETKLRRLLEVTKTIPTLSNTNCFFSISPELKIPKFTLVTYHLKGLRKLLVILVAIKTSFV